jgi:hypothetical protein
MLAQIVVVVVTMGGFVSWISLLHQPKACSYCGHVTDYAICSLTPYNILVTTCITCFNIKNSVHTICLDVSYDSHNRNLLLFSKQR